MCLCCGAGYDASPGLGLDIDIASKSPSLDGLEVREKGGGSQPQQGSGVGEAEGHSKINQDRAAQEGPDGYYGKEQHPQPVASAVPPVAAEFLVPHAQLELGHSIACAPYMYPETYYNGLLGTYGPQPLVNSQLLGMPHTRVLYLWKWQKSLRRQSRAKAELENKLIKVRKVIFLSHNEYAMRRARGCGGDSSTRRRPIPLARLVQAQIKPDPAASLVARRIPLVSVHSISDERAEDGDCSGQQRSGMAVNQAPKRVLTI
ncbi:unnamed protein product [Spirodela intermedia]|uniref:Uncharacterized protein n=1 Tax=Spirodela intermedia TaxID=51605 RepID=A0A7I8IYE6_SPIIN|nr:unnamed protein product [Spirodela intermedia]CAA6662888.1 unnamed protein product [Spirodela intermedia]